MSETSVATIEEAGGSTTENKGDIDPKEAAQAKIRSIQQVLEKLPGIRNKDGSIPTLKQLREMTPNTEPHGAIHLNSGKKSDQA